MIRELPELPMRGNAITALIIAVIVLLLLYEPLAKPSPSGRTPSRPT